MSFYLSGGVEVLGFISPTEPTDEYPVIDPLYGIDGFRNVNTLSDLNSIPNLRRRAGMVVGVSGGTTYYKLNPSPWNGSITDWSTFNSGSGGGTFTGGTVTGDTIFTQGVTATTFSASTYLGLPLDVYVTGGTYSNGTIVFTNNSGSTFDVTGLTDNDIYVTGFTYQDNTFTISDSSGNTFNATIDAVTGLTVNGDLISNNFSGTTNYIPKFTPNSYSLGNSIITNNSNNVSVGTISTPYRFYVLGNNTTAGQPLFVVRDTGRIGINTASPSAELSIQNTNPTTSQDILTLRNNGTGIGTGNSVRFINSASSSSTVGSKIESIITNLSGRNSLKFYVHGGGGSFGALQERMVIDGTGNIFANQFNGLTVSATTYLNLPLDVYVTGGTYSNGTIVFTNNSGSTFDVSGFLTGITETQVTGFTYQDNTFTISQNSGTPLTATIDTVTGLTVNGDLIITGNTTLNTLLATTISATTIGSSGDCVDDIYVSNIHSCSPLNINPLDEGNVYFGSTSGVTIDLSNKRIGIGTSTPQARLDVRAQGNLSTDVAFRVRNSGDTRNFLVVNGAGDVYNNGAEGVISNTFYGENVGRNNTGTFNTFIGYLAGSTSGTTSDSTFIGYNTGRLHTSGIRNTYVGSEAGAANTNGSQNTFIGRGAGGSIIGSSNTSVGGQSFAFVTTGSNNVTLGSEAGLRISAGTNTITSNNSIFIGFDTRANADSQTNQIVIGHTAIGLGSNTTVIGNSSTTLFRPHGNVAIGADTAGARLDVRAQGNLSTDIAFRVRNSGDTGNLFAVRGNSNIVIGDETLVNRDIIYSSNRFIRFQDNGLNVTNWFASAPPADLASSHKFGFNNNSLFELKGDSSLHIGLPGINQFSMALRVNSTQNILEGFRNAFGTNVKELRIRTGDPFTTGGIPYNSGNIVLQTGSGFNGGLNGNIIFQISSGLTEVSRITSTGLGIGTSSPSEKLDVSGKTKTINLQVTSGATSGYVLTSDSSGNGTWQIPTTFTGGTVNGLTATTISASTISAPGSTTQVIYNNGGILSANTGFTYNNINKISLGQSGTTITGNGEVALVRFTTGTEIGGIRTEQTGSGVEIGGVGYYDKIMTTNGAGIRFWTYVSGVSNTERMRITNGTGTTWGVGINTTTPSATLHVAGTNLMSAATQNVLTIVGSGNSTTSPIFTVQGSSGELFSVTDSLIGSLFSVNDISGLPIMEVFSDNTTLMGSYLAPSLNTTSRVIATTGTTNVYSIPTSAYTGAFFDYTVSDGTNLRAGNIMSIWSGSSVNITETQTTDFGNTSGLTFNMVVTSGNAILRTSGVTGNWTVKTIVRSI